MFKLNSVLMLGMLAAMNPVQAEEHRELGAHEHGHGTLNIAIEGNAINMELDIPGADIVGFEHDAETAEQKAMLDRAKAALARPLELFVLPTTAACSVSEVKVDVRGEHDEHDAAAKQSGKTENHAAEAHHNEFHATYALACKAPAEVTSIGFDFFKQFKNAQELDVNVVTGKAQSKFEVTRDKPVISLKGL
ncbi:MAG: DUF2796 domain-containing protein [Hyphomicrobium sp.]|nr:DUF2796 domain-containing protein [Hyphomicrobium sp.]